jgi:L-threonylcarbamoyladenylate synthase
VYISIQQAINFLQKEEVVALPTETVYGLAATLSSKKAVESVYTLKGRPKNNPLIIHISNPSQLTEMVESRWLDFIAPLTNAFWPGPLTIVMPYIPEKIPQAVCCGLSTAAFRMPDHHTTLEVIHATGPLVMPSANRSGSPSSTYPKHVENDFGVDFPVLDGGACRTGLESTILCWLENQWAIGRLGALTSEKIAHVLGYWPEIILPTGSPPLCPGQIHRHYAPQARLYLTSEITDFRGVVIGWEGRSYPLAERIFFLGNKENVEKIAEKLYSFLRELDEDKISEAFVDIRDLPQSGLWMTVLERLQRASA